MHSVLYVEAVTPLAGVQEEPRSCGARYNAISSFAGGGTDAGQHDNRLSCLLVSGYILLVMVDNCSVLLSASIRLSLLTLLPATPAGACKSGGEQQRHVDSQCCTAARGCDRDGSGQLPGA